MLNVVFHSNDYANGSQKSTDAAKLCIAVNLNINEIISFYTWKMPCIPFFTWWFWWQGVEEKSDYSEFFSFSQYFWRIFFGIFSLIRIFSFSFQNILLFRERVTSIWNFNDESNLSYFKSDLKQDVTRMNQKKLTFESQPPFIIQSVYVWLVFGRDLQCALCSSKNMQPKYNTVTVEVKWHWSITCIWFRFKNSHQNFKDSTATGYE